MERFSAGWWLKYVGICIRPARPDDYKEELLPGVSIIGTGWDSHSQLSQADIRKINNLVRSFQACEAHKERKIQSATKNEIMHQAGAGLVQRMTFLPKSVRRCFHRPSKALTKNLIEP